MEQRLKESGLIYTILQASYFMEVWLSPALGLGEREGADLRCGREQDQLDFVPGRGSYCGGVARQPANAARGGGGGGPEALSPLEVVGIFEEVSGKKFAVEHVPEEALRAQKAAAADPSQESFAALVLAYAQGDAIDMRATLEAIPARLVSVREYARSVAGG